MTPEQAKHELGKPSQFGSGSFWMLFFAIATFILSAFFLVRYMVGGDINPFHWDLEAWINALSGLAIAFALAGAKHMALSIDKNGILSGAMGVIIVLAFANFGLFTEMSQSMEREGHTVRARSESSPTFQAVIKSIEQGSSISSNTGVTSAIARAEQKLAQCEMRLQAGKERHCEGDKAHLASLQNSEQRIINAQKDSHGQLVTTAKAMEFDEEQHYEMIKFFRNAFGITAISASFIFSLVLMGTFELGHWYTGKHNAYLKRIIASGSGSPASIPTPPAPAASTSQQSYRTQLEAAGVPVPPSDKVLNQVGNLDFLKNKFVEGAEKAAEQAGKASAELTLTRPTMSHFQSTQTRVPPSVPAVPVSIPEPIPAIPDPVLAPAKPLPSMTATELRMFVQKKASTIEDSRFDQMWMELATGETTLSVGKMRKHYSVGDRIKTDLYQLMEVMKLIRPLDGGAYELTGEHSETLAQTKLNIIKRLAIVDQHQPESAQELTV
jgi:hypothetical protein